MFVNIFSLITSRDSFEEMTQVQNITSLWIRLKMSCIRENGKLQNNLRPTSSR